MTSLTSNTFTEYQSSNNHCGCTNQFQEKTDMTFMCCIHVNDGVILASDSRSTINNFDLSFDDNFQKIIYLPTANIVIANHGVNNFSGIPFAQAMRQMENAISSKKADVFDVIRYLTNIVQDNKSSFYIIEVPQKSELKENNKHIGVYSLEFDPDKGCRLTQIQKCYMFWNQPTDTDYLSLIYKTNNIWQVNLNHLSLTEAVNFARHLVSMYKGITHFHDKITPTVDGDIQFAVVKTDGSVKMMKTAIDTALIEWDGK